ncbi:MAG: hypothetical protein HY563_01775, partial [Ignavibacteriales bacterium]|nr:hypothetical protein [Ignavibacteriales bacterium]
MMLSTRALASRASSLQRDILRTLLYFDIFNHPLSLQEVYRFLPSDSTSIDALREAFRRPPLSEMVQERDGFVFLARSVDRIDPIVLRRVNERRADRFLAVAHVMGFLLRQFPFVRGVFISGELSKGVMSTRGDIDYVIVTAPRRVWI